MKDFLRKLLTVFAVSSAFIIGFNLGRDKERKKIPEFQED
jgi:hypothetical protein